MEFSRYKEWMGENNNIMGDVYVAGVKEFLKYARQNLGDDLISCPCTHCRMVKMFTRKKLRYI